MAKKTKAGVVVRKAYRAKRDIRKGELVFEDRDLLPRPDPECEPISPHAVPPNESGTHSHRCPRKSDGGVVCGTFMHSVGAEWWCRNCGHKEPIVPKCTGCGKCTMVRSGDLWKCLYCGHKEPMK